MSWLFATLVWGAPAAALAQPDEGAEPPPEPPPAPEPAPAAPAEAPGRAKDHIEEAKALFRQGNSLRQAGEYQRALEFYLASRELVPSVPNTINAAFCLTELGRYDEALELYEQVLTTLADELRPDQRDSVGPTIQALRGRVASVDVSANVSGAVLVVDGRQRGVVPLPGSVRVLPGRRTVRVIKDGYATFETQVDLEAGDLRRIDAKLEPLTSVGRLRVEASGGPEDEPATVYVDDVAVGTVPWEGNVGAGDHVVYVHRGDWGTDPKRTRVLRGRTITERFDLARLGPELSIVAEPAGTTIALDGLDLSGQRWQGRLTEGRHRVVAQQEGYVTQTKDFDVSGTSSPEIAIALQVDAGHPRWATPQTLIVGVSAVAGFGLGTGLGSGADDACSSVQCNQRPTLGGLVGLRAGIEFPSNLSVELGGGYLGLSRSLDRSFTEADALAGADAQYDLGDDFALHGGFASIGAAYRHDLSERVGIGARAHVGGLFATTRHSVNGAVDVGGDRTDAVVRGSGDETRTTHLLLWPEVFFRYVTEDVALGVGVGLIYAPTGEERSALGDIFPAGDTAPRPGFTPCSGTGCLAGNDAVEREPTLGPLVLVVPSVTAGYTF